MTPKAETAGGMNPTRDWAVGELRRILFYALGARYAEVWPFGSCARGVQQHSDIDIGFLPRAGLPPDVFADLTDTIGAIRGGGIRWRGQN